MKHILVPIGSTENVKNTLQYAIDFAAEMAAKVFVFRAYNVQTKAGTIINIDEIIERETNLYLRTMVNIILYFYILPIPLLLGKKLLHHLN